MMAATEPDAPTAGRGEPSTIGEIETKRRKEKERGRKDKISLRMNAHPDTLFLESHPYA